MSWGTTRRGTREEVFAQLKTDFDGILKNYPDGTIEGGDVIAVRSRAFAALEALDMTPDAYYADDLVQVSVNGSHSWSGDKEHPRSAAASFNVTRVLKAQQ
jgi:hypothetical protein